MTFSQLGLLLAALSFVQSAFPQSSSPSSQQRGWEASIGVLYRDKENIRFNGGSLLESEGEFGVVGAMGYNFTPKLDLIVGFESASIGYNLTRRSATTPGLTQQIVGDYEMFTPFVKADYNVLDRPLTPFVSAGIGWSFIDTNIPTGNIAVGCWWDPWLGYVCAGFDETRKTDAFAYQIGMGARWAFNETYGLRLEYQKQWLNLPRASGTPSFDQLELTFVVKYW